MNCEECGAEVGPSVQKGWSITKPDRRLLCLPCNGRRIDAIFSDPVGYAVEHGFLAVPKPKKLVTEEEAKARRDAVVERLKKAREVRLKNIAGRKAEETAFEAAYPKVEIIVDPEKEALKERRLEGLRRWRAGQKKMSEAPVPA